MAQPHDRLFRLVFGSPEHCAPLLRSGLPAAIVQAVDWSTLQRVPESQLSARGRETICDLLFSARPHAQSPLMLYVVLEHKSQGDRFDALQMLTQLTAIWQTRRRAHERDAYLPPILPVLIHAGPRPFPGPTQMLELFDLANLPADLRPHLPDFAIALDDHHNRPPEALRQRALSIFGLCALAALNHLPAATRDPERFAAWLAEWRLELDAGSRKSHASPDSQIFQAVLHYVLQTSALPRETVEPLLIRQLTKPAMNDFTSTWDQIYAEGEGKGREEGRLEGREEGREEGRVEGQFALLQQLLHQRFGAERTSQYLPRVRTAGPAELQRLADRILDANSIEELFSSES